MMKRLLMVVALVAAAVLAAPPATAQEATPSVLIFGPNSGGLADQTPGVDVTVWDAETWTTKSTADFAAFDAIVFGDAPACDFGVETWGPAIANRSTWSSAVDGNVILIGTDTDLHGKDQLVHQAVAFAAATPGRTGLYVSLSCVYHYNFDYTTTPGPVSIDLLADLGDFKVNEVGNCTNAAHIVATHPALAGLTDEYLSDWGCSVHEGFTSWPATFQPLAIVTDSTTTPYTASDGTQGTVYILSSGATTVGLSLSPNGATAPAGTTHTVTATYKGADDAPIAGATVVFSVTSGPNAGTTSPPCDGAGGACITDSAGQVSWTYTSNGTVGDDAIRAFVDLDTSGTFDGGEPQTTSGMTWTEAEPPIEIPEAPVLALPLAGLAALAIVAARRRRAIA